MSDTTQAPGSGWDEPNPPHRDPASTEPPEVGERMYSDNPGRVLTDEEVEQLRTSGVLLHPWDD